MCKKAQFFIFLTFIFVQAEAQQRIELHPMYGTVFKHSPAYKPVITEPSFGLHASYFFRPKSGSIFYEKFNYPSIGVHAIFNHYGDHDIFGSSIGITTSLNFYLIEKPYFNLQLTTAIGLGYVTGEYDRIENPVNNVIGSHINMCPNVFISSQVFMTDRWYIKPGVGIVHFSNGHIQLPNLGINFVHGSLGIGYTLDDKFHKDSFRNNGFKLPRLKNEITLLQGVSDRGTSDNTQIRPTYGIMFQRLFYTSDINAIKLGISGEYKNDDYDYGTYQFLENADLALTFGDELFFGRLSFNVLVGVYVHSYLSYEKKKYAYQRWGLAYRIPIKSDKVSLIAGAHLKVHYGAAELTEARVSLLF